MLDFEVEIDENQHSKLEALNSSIQHDRSGSSRGRRRGSSKWNGRWSGMCVARASSSTSNTLGIHEGRISECGLSSQKSAFCLATILLLPTVECLVAPTLQACSCLTDFHRIEGNAVLNDNSVARTAAVVYCCCCCCWLQVDSFIERRVIETEKLTSG